MSVPLLIVTGTVGVGKTTVAFEMHEHLRELEISHLYVDIDELSNSYPLRGLFGRGAALDALGAMWPVYEVDRLIVADVIEDRSNLTRFEEAIPGAEITVCRLVAPEALRLERITGRDEGARRDWHLERSVELDAILDAAKVADFTVENGDRPPLDVAQEVLNRASWT